MTCQSEGGRDGEDQRTRKEQFVTARRSAAYAYPTARETLADVQRALAAVPLFDGLPQRHLRTLARAAKVASYRVDAQVVREGIAGSALYVILDGRARVVRRGRTLARLRRGNFFGEISLLDGGPRSASVVAESTLRCAKLAGRDLRGLLEREPRLAVRMLAEVAARLRGHENPPAG